MDFMRAPEDLEGFVAVLLLAYAAEPFERHRSAKRHYENPINEIIKKKCVASNNVVCSKMISMLCKSVTNLIGHQTQNNLPAAAHTHMCSNLFWSCFAL